MSRLTLNYFLKLHEEMMNTDIDYRKGYQYASKCSPWKMLTIEGLKELQQSFIDLSLRDGNTCAMGHAYAIKEAVSQLESSVA